MKTEPIGVLLVMLAGWINRHQQNVIECLREENKVLGDKFAGMDRRTSP